MILTMKTRSIHSSKIAVYYFQSDNLTCIYDKYVTYTCITYMSYIKFNLYAV